METAENVRTSGNESSEVERLKEEVRREHDMYLRALADLDNYRRRVERDRAAATHAGNRDLILSLLDVLDAFEGALRHLPDAESSTAAGVQAIYRKMIASLERQGVTPFSSVGERFDPALHEAIGSVENAEDKPDTVVEEVHRGYRWNNELLRPARVLVAQ